MRIACIVAFGVFGFFAYLQLNDAEQYGTELWLGWVILYAGIAIVSLRTAWMPLPRSFYRVGAGMAVVAAAIRATAIEWGEPILYNESNPSGNETGGLLIVAVWLALLASRARGQRPVGASPRIAP
jgi:hypothetical protein